MANKINWTNVAQPDFGDANALLGHATNTIQEAIKSGQTTLNDVDAAVQKGIKSNLAYYLENLPKESFNEANRANTLTNIHNHMVNLDNSLGGGLTAEMWNVGNEYLAKQQLTDMVNREHDQKVYDYNAQSALANYLADPSDITLNVEKGKLNPRELMLFNAKTTQQAIEDAQNKSTLREATNKQIGYEVNDVLGSFQYTNNNINSLKLMLTNPNLSPTDRATIQEQINTMTTGLTDSLSKLSPQVRSGILGEISKNQASYDKELTNALFKGAGLALDERVFNHNVDKAAVAAEQKNRELEFEVNKFNQTHALDVFEAMNGGNNNGNGGGRGDNNKENPYAPSKKAAEWGFSSIVATTGQVDKNGKPKITLDNNAIINTFTNKITATRDNYYKDTYGTTSFNDWLFNNKDLMNSPTMKDSPWFGTGTFYDTLMSSWGALQEGLKEQGITMTDMDKIRVAKAISTNPKQLNLDKYFGIFNTFYARGELANLAINLRLQEEGAIKQRIAQEINTGLDILTKEYNGKSSAAELAYLTGLNVNPLFKQYADTTLQRTVSQIATNYHQRDQARQQGNSVSKSPPRIIGNVDLDNPLAPYGQQVGTNTVIRPAGQFSVLKPK